MFGPNITGYFNARNRSILGSYSAPFKISSLENSDESALEYNLEAPRTYHNVSFNLNARSSIYNGSKLQPAALQVLPCIRY